MLTSLKGKNCQYTLHQRCVRKTKTDPEASQHHASSEVQNNGQNKIMPSLGLQRSNRKNSAVYKINCKNCSCSYIGETSKKVGDRLKEHN